MFESILFPQNRGIPLQTQEPECFRDLNLDQVFAPILRENPNLAPWIYTLCPDRETVFFRQAVLKDLRREENRQLFGDFSRELLELSRLYRAAAEELSSGDSWRNTWLVRGHMLELGNRYCSTLETLREKLRSRVLVSRGLENFKIRLEAYCESPAYGQLSGALDKLNNRFGSLQYCLLIRNGTVRVKKYQGEPDLSEEILRVFERFRQGEGKDYRQQLPERPYADHVEVGILHCLSKLYPEEFDLLENFIRDFPDFLEEGICRVAGELLFYLSWLKRTEPMEQAGLPFCIPGVAEPGERRFADGFFDLALADNLGSRIVANDFFLEPPEQIIVVTGPNQGGKTTFARAFGQLHYLAALGLTVPGRQAALGLSDRVVTHFERQETIQSLSGKLQDDLIRLKALLDQTTDRTVFVINEIFASTTQADALELGGRMMELLLKTGAAGILVTFLEELARTGPETVSMMSSVEPENPDCRTYRVVRRPPDGQAYAMTLARKHGLTYEMLRRRIQK